MAGIPQDRDQDFFQYMLKEKKNWSMQNKNY